MSHNSYQKQPFERLSIDPGLDKTLYQILATRRFSRPNPTVNGANSSFFLSTSSDLQLRNLAVRQAHAFELSFKLHIGHLAGIERVF